MSSAAAVLPVFSFALPELLPKFPSPPPAPRRKASREQGMALERIGHAIEYLVDSRLHDANGDPAASAAAVRILMSCSRSVFTECDEVLPWRQRVGSVVRRRFSSASRPVAVLAEQIGPVR